MFYIVLPMATFNFLQQIRDKLFDPVSLSPKSGQIAQSEPGSSVSDDSYKGFPMSLMKSNCRTSFMHDVCLQTPPEWKEGNANCL